MRLHSEIELIEYSDNGKAIAFYFQNFDSFMKCLQQNYANPNTFDLNVIFFNLEGQTNILKNVGLKNSYNPEMIVKKEINEEIDNSFYFNWSPSSERKQLHCLRCCGNVCFSSKST
jgi:hypothetical protein